MLYDYPTIWIRQSLQAIFYDLMLCNYEGKVKLDFSSPMQMVKSLNAQYVFGFSLETGDEHDAEHVKIMIHSRKSLIM